MEETIVTIKPSSFGNCFGKPYKPTIGVLLERTDYGVFLRVKKLKKYYPLQRIMKVTKRKVEEV